MIAATAPSEPESPYAWVRLCASLALMKVSQAVALLDGSDFVLPEHIREMAVPVIAHRLMLDPQARFSGATAQAVVESILQELPVPA